MAEPVSDADVWYALQSHLQAMGYFENVDIGEPKAPPSPTAAAIIPMSGRVDTTVLNAPRYLRTIAIRVYGEGIGENREQVELELDQIRANILRDLTEDFTFGATVVNWQPRQSEWKWGWQTISGTMFRLLDMTVVYRADVAELFAE